MRTSLLEKAYTLACKGGYGARASSVRRQIKAWPGPGPPTFCSEHSTKMRELGRTNEVGNKPRRSRCSAPRVVVMALRLDRQLA